MIVDLFIYFGIFAALGIAAYGLAVVLGFVLYLFPKTREMMRDPDEPQLPAA